jgi:hypothetical protein
MAHAYLEHAFSLRHSARDVYEHLREPRHYLDLSRYNAELRAVTLERDAAHYVMVERVPLLGVLHVDNPLAITLTERQGDDHFEIGGDVRSRGRITLAYRYTITPSEQGCELHDSVTITAPPVLLQLTRARVRSTQLAFPDLLSGQLG